MKSVLEVIESTTQFFQRRNVPQPRLQIELLLAHVLQLPRMHLYLQFDRPLPDEILDQLRPLVKRRAAREPLQHILGTTGFEQLRLKCDARAFLPRPETEVLVEWVAEFLKLQIKGQINGSVVDVGTGSGAIVLALAAQFPDLTWWGVDRSEAALELARENAQICKVPHVRWGQGNLLEPVTDRIFAVVSNPPYLTPEEIETAEPEVHHDPYEALYGGKDGLEVIRELIQQAATKTDHLFLEVGCQQAEAVTRLLQEAGFHQTEIRRDLLKVPRFLAGHRNPTVNP